MSGGYDVSLFAAPPDAHLLCSVCYGVLRQPVGLPCRHTFCRKCIVQWLVRQRTCPCCRRECKNVEEGCPVTVPLHHRRIHLLSCQYEPAPCPHRGCPAWVARKDLSDHGERCPHGRRPRARGAQLSAARAHHDRPGRRQEEWRRRWRRRRASCQLLLAGLDRSLRHLRRATRRLQAQLAWLGGRLEGRRVDDRRGPSA
ncbi:RING finger protein 151 isoform X2 [Tachyglossus aculeatus]|uniref:RING finger protein 151 isoform X2 n=1 Tax=Tachyglossus aculeatus TaxID=9261 RepID=UPI0018F3EF37|nr:RING finger protein 151 isoform X2 [Tachyglossus aculeatus]